MDRLALVPENEEDHDVLPILSEAFQDTFRINKYPNNVAENIKKYTIDDKFENIKTNAVAVVKFVEEQDEQSEDIYQTEMEMLRSHAMAMVEKHRISNHPCQEEMLRLKRHGLFPKLPQQAIHSYGLIQQTDLYPSKIEQYLDFTFNPTLHTCTPCTPPETKNEQLTIRKKHQILKAEETAPPSLKLEPDEIVFKNYELGYTYKLKFKLRNIGRSPQVFQYYNFPKDCPFRLEMLSNSCRLAAGMSAEFVVSFHPKMYKNHSEWLWFKTTPKHKLVLLVTSIREPPKLFCYVYNPLLPPDEIEKPGPESKYFSERRRHALNYTIDCGTCLLGNYTLVTLIMKNVGQKGQFLVSTENEWVFNKLCDSSTRARELTQGCFSIFPVCFEIDRGEVCEIFALFVPDKEGVFTEKIVIICDNNSHQEIELLGDCVSFFSNFLKVDMYLMDNTFCYAHPVVQITMAPYETSAFILSVINDGPISFEHYWAVKGSEEILEGVEGKKRMGVDWIQLIHNTKCLPSFSTTDIVVQLTAETSEEGLYYIFMSLYLAKIPIVSMPECHFFVIKNHDDIKKEHGCTNPCLTSVTLTREELRNDNLFNMIYKYADVHLCELEIVCAVRIPQIPEPLNNEEEVQQLVVDLTAKRARKGRRKHLRLKLTKQFLNFGIIPKGVQVSKSFGVESLSNEETNWKLIEIRYINDTSELELCKEVKTLSCSQGIMRKQGHKKRITYTIETKSPTCWVSILALFSSTACSCKDFTLESICLVVYEVAEIKISIRTDSMLPVLCPKEFMYVGIPTVHTIYVHNSGVVVGCFYFLKPKGNEASKMRIKFQPQSGMVLPGKTIEVKVQMMALENGIFEDLFVPCFTGDLERLDSLRILCTVASINVHFYLPNEERGYHRILWPPKSETKLNWTTTEVLGEDWLPIRNIPDRGESLAELITEEPKIDAALKDLIAANSIAATYPTVKTKAIRMKKAATIRFYIQNLTPIHGTCAVEATNYGPDHQCLNHTLVKAKMRPPEFFWEKSCQDGHGIVIEPQHSGTIVPHEVLEVDLWIYANTWGKYLEEIIVEINDLTPFCFNLIVEVVGLPLLFPFARNTILEHPTIRFENITYTSDGNKRSFTVTNLTSIPLHVSWYIFVPDGEHGPFNVIIDTDEERVRLQLSSHYYGAIACSGCIELKPLELTLEKQSTVTMMVTVNICECRPVSIYKTSLKYDLVGFISLRNEDSFKENYFRRVCGVDLTPARVSVLVTLELPIMEIDLSSDDTVVDLFVNDILLKHIDDPKVYLLLRNIDVAPIHFSIEIDKPFHILEVRTVPTGITNSKNLVLHRQECLQVMLSCHFTHEDLLQFAEFIYNVDKEPRNQITELTSVIKKDLCIQQEGARRQIIPFEVRLHYPKIEVKPAFIKFGQCLVYRTKKTLLSIYNVTGAPVSFEIYKTSQRDDFEINPSHGILPANTGVNKQFIDVALYFTPRQCQLYIESLRIVTNIPQYFIDVPITGHGSNNEKFYVN